MIGIGWSIFEGPHLTPPSPGAGAPVGPNARIDRHGPWRRDEGRMADGIMTAAGWIRNGAVSGVESKVRQVRA
jgi:hypothetical protein